MNGFWKPPPALRFGGASLPSTSLSSSDLIFFALFFLGAAFFFLTTFFSPPPRVALPRAMLSSCACSCAARRASASSTDDDRFVFFRAGSGEAEGSVSTAWSDVPLVAGRFLGETAGSVTLSCCALVEMESKRATMRSLIASYNRHNVRTHGEKKAEQ